MKTVKLTINGLPVEVPEGTTILNAAKQVQVKIPSLCYHPDLPAWAACGICVVKIKGFHKLVRACVAPAAAKRARNPCTSGASGVVKQYTSRISSGTRLFGVRLCWYRGPSG